MARPPVQSLALPDAGLAALANEARTEGFAFVDRLIAGWEDGSNRFDLPGEQLICIRHGGAIAAVCGLNRDPYAYGDCIGRLRHLYVRQPWRGRGHARRLIEALMSSPHGFHTVRLRTPNDSSARMYEHIGFQPVALLTATHIMLLGGSNRDQQK
jgi:GNAT superfamily N-acetyltransferase